MTRYLKSFGHHHLGLSEEGVITSGILHRPQELSLELFDILGAKQTLLDVPSEMVNSPQRRVY